MTVRVEKSGTVWTIINHRPEARNAINPETADLLYNAFIEFEEDDTASVAVFWGDGGAFCSGWDLKDAALLNSTEPFDERNIPKDGGGYGNGTDIPPAFLGPTRLELNKPVIAAVAGPAVAGGMELALWCDFRVLEESAYFGVYCRRWGVPLIDGGTVRLPRLVGEGRALEIILTGRKVSAQESLNIGLCEYVVPDGGSRAKAEQLAQQIAQFPQICMRADRRSARSQHGLSLRDAMIQEWYGGREALFKEGIEGAANYASGLWRNGNDITWSE